MGWYLVARDTKVYGSVMFTKDMFKVNDTSSVYLSVEEETTD